MIAWCDVDVWSCVGRNEAERLTSESLERMLALREYRDTHCMVDCYVDDPRDYEDDDDGLCAAGPRADEIDWTGLDEAIEALSPDS